MFSMKISLFVVTLPLVYRLAVLVPISFGGNTSSILSPFTFITCYYVLSTKYPRVVVGGWGGGVKDLGGIYEAKSKDFEKA